MKTIILTGILSFVIVGCELTPNVENNSYVLYLPPDRLSSGKFNINNQTQASNEDFKKSIEQQHTKEDIDIVAFPEYELPDDNVKEDPVLYIRHLREYIKELIEHIDKLEQSIKESNAS